MKILKMAAFALLLSTAFIACSKDKDNTSAPFVLEGTWKGQTGNGGFFGLNIKAGGTLERIGSTGSVSATGSWQLVGNTLSGTYDFSNGTHVIMSATVDMKKYKLTGTWSNNGGEQGTMYADKTN